MRYAVLLCLLIPICVEKSLHADLLISDSFDYAVGSLKGNNGGGGPRWSGAWSSDDGVHVTSPGLTYVDSLGNTLDVAGNATRGTSSSSFKSERDISPILSTDVWLGVLITGAAGARQVGIALDQKFFVGQGQGGNENGSNWAMYDQDGLVFDTGLVAGGDTSFLVAKIEFSGGDERAWLWRNPNLNAEPDKANALNGASGNSIKDFTVAKIQVHHNTNGIGLVDELRIGTAYADVSPFTAVPEPSSLMLVGLFSSALWGTRRRRHRPS